VSLDTDLIRARAAAATEGPWELEPIFDDGSGYRLVHRWRTPDRRGRDGTTEREEWVCGDLNVSDADAEFIAAARTDVPALCDELDRTREALRRYGWHIEHCPARWGGESVENDMVLEDFHLECTCGFRAALAGVEVPQPAAEDEPLGVAKRCQYFSTDQPGVGHCQWCAEGGLCPDEAVPLVVDSPTKEDKNDE
jgi:hypothetical protein